MHVDEDLTPIQRGRYLDHWKRRLKRCGVGEDPALKLDPWTPEEAYARLASDIDEWRDTGTASTIKPRARAKG